MRKAAPMGEFSREKAFVHTLFRRPITPRLATACANFTAPWEQRP